MFEKVSDSTDRMRIDSTASRWVSASGAIITDPPKRL